MADAGTAQERALDDARVRWHEAIAALGLAQREAENLHSAMPQLLADGPFWNALPAFADMTGQLENLIKAASDG